MKFRFDGGDGDQDLFSHKFTAIRVHEDWFPDALNRGPAYLLKVCDGCFEDSYLAITSRVLSSLEEQIKNGKYVSVVVHLIKRPGAGFTDAPEYLHAVGMAAIEVLS